MNGTRLVIRSVITLVLAVSLSSCHSGSQTAAPAPSLTGEATLYQRLGGESALRAVVSQFVDNLAADPRISHYFADTDLGPFKSSLTNLIGQSTGGPQKYVGRDMKTTHAGLGIKDADFDDLIEDLGKALDQYKVGEKEKGELVAILTPLRKDIVQN